MSIQEKKIDLQKELGNLKEDVDNLRAHTAKMVSKVKDASKEKLDSTVESTKKAAKDAEKTLEKNPVATVMGAVGLGAMLGSLARHFLSSKKKKK